MKVFDLFKSKQSTEPTDTQATVTVIYPDSEKDTQTTHTAEDPNTVHVHNLILLDASGSMHSICQAAIDGVNETLGTIRQAQTENGLHQQHTVTLVSFTSTYGRGLELRYRGHNTAIQKVGNIDHRHYQPGGNTPLYDAMGYTINELRKEVGPDDIVLVTIITDGEENSSRKYNFETIKTLVEEMKRRDWVFTYIGANQDVTAVASAMGIDNYMEFDATCEGTHVMFSQESDARKRFFARVKPGMGAAARADLAKTYFDDDIIEDETEGK